MRRDRSRILARGISGRSEIIRHRGCIVFPDFAPRIIANLDPRGHLVVVDMSHCRRAGENPRRDRQNLVRLLKIVLCT